LKVLKALADLERHQPGWPAGGNRPARVRGPAPFGEETLAKIRDLRAVFGLDLGATASHRLAEPKLE
jgi:hypothetical protein